MRGLELPESTWGTPLPREKTITNRASANRQSHTRIVEADAADWLQQQVPWPETLGAHGIGKAGQLD
jgi:hypothetical protein